MSEEREIAPAFKGIGQLYRNIKNHKLYKIVGSCISKSSNEDEYAVLYREWDDFSDLQRCDSQLFCRNYNDFCEKFEDYDCTIDYTPTDQQIKKDYGLTRRSVSKTSKSVKKNRSSK